MKTIALVMFAATAAVACGSEKGGASSGAAPAVADGTCEPKNTSSPTTSNQGPAGAMSSSRATRSARSNEGDILLSAFASL